MRANTASHMRMFMRPRTDRISTHFPNWPHLALALWSASGIVFALWPTGILILIQHFRLLCVVLAKFALCILLLESN